MNSDIHNIFESYQNKQLDEQPVAPAAPAAQAAPAVAGPTNNMPARAADAVDPAQAMAQVEQLFANGAGQDQQTLQAQVNALATAQQSINPAIQKATSELETVRDQAEQGIEVSDSIDPNTGGYKQESQIQQLNQQYTRLSQLAQSVQQPAQQMGIDTSTLMESLQEYMDYIKQNVEVIAEALIPGKDTKSAEKRMMLNNMVQENTTPDINVINSILDEEDDEEELSADPNYLRDVLGMEPEDFEHEDPDQAAMDRQDAVELSKHDRPSAGPEDGLMGDVEALERLLDDETRAVMDDEGGAMSRREAREVAKDIIKQLIDRL